MKTTLETQSKTDIDNISSITQQLLNQLPELLKADQKAGALCNFYWVSHMAERGFLEQPDIIALIQQRENILPLCSVPDKIRLCEQLLKVAEKTNLSTEQIALSQQLSQLHRFSFNASEQTPTPSDLPKSQHYYKQLISLAYLTKARQQLTVASSTENASLRQKNTQAFNQLEIELQYDLVVPIYIEQLRVYRKENAAKISNVLTCVDRFARLLQTQKLYAQTQCLYQLILKELRIHQNFYDNTCLRDIDERFLLESLWVLQENCLGRSVAQIEEQKEKINYFWSENFEYLRHLRAEKKESVDKLMTTIDELRFSPDLIEAVENLQSDITQSMKGFFARLFKQVESLLGEPPYDYCLMVLGSIARGDMTPFSDLESVLLVEKPCSKGSLEVLYFETLWKLVAFQIKALGESYVENPGLHIDEECHPLLPGLITTPEKLIETYGPKTISISKHSEDRLVLTLLSSTVVYSHEDEDKVGTLWERYHHLLNEQLESNVSFRQEKALEQLKAETEVFKQQDIPDFQSNCSVKEKFLAPLTYLFDNLAFYHHLDVSNLAAILNQLDKRKILDHSFAQYCCAAIAELNLWRLHQHLQHNKAEDNFPSDLPKHQQVRLKSLWQGLIQVLYNVVNKLTQTGHAYHPIIDSFEIKKSHATLEKKQDILDDPEISELFLQLIGCLLYTTPPEDLLEAFILSYNQLPINWRKSFFRKLEQIPVWGVDNNCRENVIRTLLAQGDIDGWQMQIERESVKLRTDITNLFEPVELVEQSKTNRAIKICIPSKNIDFEEYQFKKNVYDQLFTENGSLKEKPIKQAGRHVVLRVNHEGQSFWFKFMPEQPGTEFAITRLERYLGGQGTAMTQIVKICRGDNPGMAVQISAHVPGNTLEESLAQHPGHVTNIDQASFTQTLLRVLLTNPEDDKGDDYFLVPSEDEKHYRLMCIDNERAYYQPDTTEGRFIWKKEILQVKSALYCLNQMQKPLDADILKVFSYLDTFAMLERWLQELRDEQNHYTTLFNEKDVREHFRNKHPGPSILGLPMADGLMKELLTRLDSMQQVIRLHHDQQQPITGMDLLKVVQPQLAEYYQTTFKNHPAPEELDNVEAAANLVNKRLGTINKLYEITLQGYKQSSYSSMKAMTKSLRLENNLTEKDVMQITQGKLMSPIQALKELQRLQVTRHEDIEQALLAKTQKSITDFQKLPIRYRLLIIKHITDTETASVYILTKTQQIHLLKAMFDIPFHVLSLTYFRCFLTDNLLLPFLKRTRKHLIAIDLAGCNQLTGNAIENLSKLCPHLEILILKNINDSLVKIDDFKFSCLKELDVSGCKQLQELIIQAPGLKTLNAEDCSQLQYVSTGTLMPLNANFNACVMLKEIGIAKLVEESTYLPYLYATGCRSLPHTQFRTTYPRLAHLSLSIFSTVEIERLKNELETCTNILSTDFESLPPSVHDTYVECIKQACNNRKKYLNIIISLLLKTLRNDSDYRVKTATAEALGQCGQNTDDVINGLLYSLMDKSCEVKIAVITALGDLDKITDKIITGLNTALNCSDYRIKNAAVCALSKLDVVINDFNSDSLNTLKNDYANIKTTVANIFGKHSKIDERIESDLYKAITDKIIIYEDKKRSSNGGDLLVDELLKILSDVNEADTVIKVAAAYILANVSKGDAKVIKTLHEQARDTTNYVRFACARALGRIANNNSEKFDEILTRKLLFSENWRDREFAILIIEEFMSIQTLISNLQQTLRAELIQKSSIEPSIVKRCTNLEITSDFVIIPQFPTLFSDNTGQHTHRNNGTEKRRPMIHENSYSFKKN